MHEISKNCFRQNIKMTKITKNKKTENLLTLLVCNRGRGVSTMATPGAQAACSSIDDCTSPTTVDIDLWTRLLRRCVRPEYLSRATLLACWSLRKLCKAGDQSHIEPVCSNRQSISSSLVQAGYDKLHSRSSAWIRRWPPA